MFCNGCGPNRQVQITVSAQHVSLAPSYSQHEGQCKHGLHDVCNLL